MDPKLAVFDHKFLLTGFLYETVTSFLLCLALLVSAPSTVLIAETNKSVDVKDVAIGTIILVCAGEQIPLDGKVAKGKASVDESSITGESMPVQKESGSTVFSGTVIQSGFLKVGLSLLRLMSITFDYLNPNLLQWWFYSCLLYTSPSPRDRG